MAGDPDSIELQKHRRQQRRAAKRRASLVLPLVLDFCELSEAREGRAPRYVQVGAHDGQHSDPMVERAIDGRWTGLLMEPSVAYFQRLQTLHKGRDGMVLVNAGVSSEAGEMTLYRISDAAAHLYSADLAGCASLTRDNLVRHMAKDGPVTEDHVVGETVRLEPLRQLVVEHGFSDAAGLIIDVEGHEAEVFAGFDFAQFAPRFIFFEHKHLPQPAYREIVEKCHNADYQLFRLRQDTLCLGPDLASPGLVAAIEGLEGRLLPTG